MSSSISGFIPRIRSEVSSMPGPTALEEINNRVEEAAALYQRLLHLRNEQSGVSKFPVEVLQTVLILAIRPTDEKRKYDFDPPTWRQHVNLTLVCKFWRHVALNCPEFWRCVPYRPGKHLPEIFARSKKHSLSFRWNCSGGKDVNGKLYIPLYYLPTLLDANRMEDLHVKANSALLQTIMGHFPDSAPILRSLCLRDSRRRLAEEHEMLPFHVFQVPKPCLQILRLERVKVPWEEMYNNSCLPVGLIELMMFKCSPPTEKQIHHILCGSPNLEILSITRALPTSIDVVNRPARAKLLKLKTLMIISHLHQFSYFYSTLHHAIETRIEFSIIVNNANLAIEQYKSYVVFILGLCGVSVAKPLRTHKRMCVMSDGRVTILRLDDEDTDQVPHPLHSFDQLRPGEQAPRVNIAFHWAMDNLMLEHVHVQGVERLVLNCNRILSRRSRAEWHGLLERHPKVEHLHIVSSAVQNILQALGDSTTNVKAVLRRSQRRGKEQKAVQESIKLDAEERARYGRVPLVPYSGWVYYVEDGRPREKAPVVQLLGGQVHQMPETVEKTKTDAESNRPKLLCPGLRTISLSKTRFDLRLMTGCIKFRAILDLLMDRINFGTPIELLEFRGCSSIPQELFTRFEEVIGSHDLIGFPESGTAYGWVKGANRRKRQQAKREVRLAAGLTVGRSRAEKLEYAVAQAAAAAAAAAEAAAASTS